MQTPEYSNPAEDPQDQTSVTPGPVYPERFAAPANPSVPPAAAEALDALSHMAPAGYPPRQFIPDPEHDLDSDVAARDAERFAIYAEEILASAGDAGHEAELHGNSLAIMALVYEVKALRGVLIEGGFHR